MKKEKKANNQAKGFRNGIKNAWSNEYNGWFWLRQSLRQFAFKTGIYRTCRTNWQSHSQTTKKQHSLDFCLKAFYCSLTFYSLNLTLWNLFFSLSISFGACCLRGRKIMFFILSAIVMRLMPCKMIQLTHFHEQNIMANYYLPNHNLIFCSHNSIFFISETKFQFTLMLMLMLIDQLSRSIYALA